MDMPARHHALANWPSIVSGTTYPESVLSKYEVQSTFMASLAA